LSRPSQSSLLFPYTTLFRSLCHSEAAHLFEHLFVAAPGAGRQTVGIQPFGQEVENPPALRTGKFVDLHTRIYDFRFTIYAPAKKDRKSTRLNSSHQIISYAV